MEEAHFDCRAELQVSPKVVLAALVVLSCMLLLGTHAFGHSPYTMRRGIALFLALMALAGAGLAVAAWQPALGRWTTLLVLTAAVHLVARCFDVAGSLSWAAIPSALALPLAGPAAVGPVALAQTVLVLLLAGEPRLGLSPSDLPAALVSIWGVTGATLAICSPLRRFASWMDDYAARARRVTEEARGRRAELEQALDGVANANRQLSLANERMARLRAIAEDAQRAKSAFVSNVSHELRTPLNMIIGLVELMVETPDIYDLVLSPKMRADLKVVHRNCEHLSEMINDVLDLTRLDAGCLLIHRERVDLQEIVECGIEAISPLIQQKRLDLDVSLSSGLPEVACDRTRIRQVILNLMSNAARFTEVGGIAVEVRHDERQVIVGVTDTGPGISQEDLGRIFEPFWQGTSQLWRDKGGSGLGLAISKRFVELHGGRMWVESEPGAGTSFFFTLPCAAPIDHVLRPGHQVRNDWVWRERAFRAGRSGETDQLGRPRVVVCDETGEIESRFVNYSDQVEFVNARDLPDAAQMIRECPVSALVLNTAASDSVWALARSARDHARATPILAFSVPRSATRALGAGARNHLTKPITRADLREVLEDIGAPIRRVLVVDDDPDFVDLLTRMLHACDSGLEVVEASSGQAALAALRQAEFDLILLDIVMPDVDGWDLLQAIVEDPTVHNAPTFFVSAQDPADQPLASEALLVTVDGGLSLEQLLRCSMEIPALLLQPDQEPYPAFE